MAMHIELARTMVYKAAWLKDQGKRFKKEAAIAKLYASEICMKACDQAIQIHGIKTNTVIDTRTRPSCSTVQSKAPNI